MKSTKIISNLNSKSPILYEIETTWGRQSNRSFKFKIVRLPNYSPKTPSNDVIDISQMGNLLGFTKKLAIGLGTARLALPSDSTKNKIVSLIFKDEFLKEMTKKDLITVQCKIASTLVYLNTKLEANPLYLNSFS
ncbi:MULTISPECIES: hypothetical protein [Leptospira]|uniref:hypothetical protein n=1 Tax=Leptospira TaxID=171 RepID=UPI0010916382|nr:MULTISPECIES: hypothetical protein [Leptospira]TGL99670.1 hypothetical protein EHQ79_18005 [Leptospira jelokensis]TGM80502.1 hypothetical protein EHQ99_12595 [Leptospira bouyouniensis]